MKERDRSTPAIWFALAVAAAAALYYQPHDGGQTQFAYIGPGAGFAFLGSFLTLVAGFFLSLFSFLLWPFRIAARQSAAFSGPRMTKKLI